MSDSHKYPHLGDGKPLSPEILHGVANAFYATGWITMLSTPKLWSALRRIPSKAFLVERIDAWLALVTRNERYLMEDEKNAAALDLRSAPFQRLRALLVDWEPPELTPEICAAARELHIAEFGRPPDENWGRPDLSGMPLEFSVIWPEGEWNEEAFVAGRIGHDLQSKP